MVVQIWQILVCRILQKHLFVYMDVLSVCTFAHQKRVSGFMELQLLDSCEPLCGCWDLNSGLLEEQPVLFISEPSLQPEFYILVVIDLGVIYKSCLCCLLRWVWNSSPPLRRQGLYAWSPFLPFEKGSICVTLASLSLLECKSMYASKDSEILSRVLKLCFCT
jgi:hypothetical protein